MVIELVFQSIFETEVDKIVLSAHPTLAAGGGSLDVISRISG